MALSHIPHFGSIKKIDPVYVKNIVIPPKKMGNGSKLVRPKPEANLSLTSHNDRCVLNKGGMDHGKLNTRF